MDSVVLLEKLSNAFGVSGFEEEVREIIEKMVKPTVDEMCIDPLGNLIATRTGRSPRKLMLDAHMDEIGFMVSYIEENGFLRFAPLGGWDVRILPSHAMTIRTRSGTFIKGIIGTPPPHILSEQERERPYKLEELFIDLGACSRADVEKLGIRIGSPAVIAYAFERLNEEVISGKAFDDRAGCAVLIQTLERLQDTSLDLTLVCNFAIGEETGLRGARTAAYQIGPDLALAVEGTVGADTPGVPAPRQPAGLGKGPAITVADRTLTVSGRLVRFLEELAEEHSIPYQHKLPIYGGTDAGAIQTSKGGVLAGAVSVPCRYIHSPFSLLRLDDFEKTVELVTQFAKTAQRLLEA
jgi:endoglucanase